MTIIAEKKKQMYIWPRHPPQIKRYYNVYLSRKWANCKWGVSHTLFISYLNECWIPIRIIVAEMNAFNDDVVWWNYYCFDDGIFWIQDGKVRVALQFWFFFVRITEKHLLSVLRLRNGKAYWKNNNRKEIVFWLAWRRNIPLWHFFLITHMLSWRRFQPLNLFYRPFWLN